MLELLVAEALGLLDRGAVLRVGREERRVGLQAGRARAAISRDPCTLRPSIFSAGTVSPGKPQACSTPFEITGIRSTRL